MIPEPAAMPSGPAPAWCYPGLYRCEVAALSEGLCPVHGLSLSPAAVPPGRIAGHCMPCQRFWGYNAASEQVGWWLDHDPLHPERPSCAVPYWMEWRAEP